MVTIIKQSGNPVDEGDAKKFLDEWKEGFDRLFDAEGDMAIVTKKAQEYEEELMKKYKIERSIELPKSMNNLNRHFNLKRLSNPLLRYEMSDILVVDVEVLSTVGTRTIVKHGKKD